MPPDSDEPPHLSKILVGLLAVRGLSKRHFAKLLHEADPRQSWDSWLTSVKRYTRDEEAMMPTEETARLMEDVLDVPEGTLVRQTRREQLEEQVQRLQAENQRLRAALEKRMRDEPGSGRGRVR